MSRRRDCRDLGKMSCIFVEIERMLTFYGSRTDVSDKLGETDCRLFHLFKLFTLGDGHGCFFNNLLVASLDGAVATK